MSCGAAVFDSLVVKLDEVPHIGLSVTANLSYQPPTWAREASNVANQGTRTAIVTGAAQGIGKGIALRLARDGYNVCVNDIPASESKLQDVAAEIKSVGGESVIAVADVSDRTQVVSLVEKSVNELGPLSTMVANAGIAQVKLLLEITDEDLRRICNVNVFGVFYCFAEAARQMIKQGGGGKLIGAGSAAAFLPFPGLNHYVSTKFAVRGLILGFASEMAPHKITVNAYAPGIVDIPMWTLIDEGIAKAKGVAHGEILKQVMSVDGGAVMR